MIARARSLSPAWSAGVVSGAALLALYAATLAPDLALWDAGEFSAAAAVYGIPHPPGTPLYVTIARSWSLLFPWLSTAVATNLLSAVASAAAFALLGALVAHRMGRARWGIAAAICAGCFFTAWSSATSAEAYAPAFLLGVCILWSAEYTGAARDLRSRRNGAALTVYLTLLAVPLHLTSLLVVPAAMVLASRLERSGVPVALLIGGAGVVAAGATSPSMLLLAAGTLAMVAGGWGMSRSSTNAAGDRGAGGGEGRRSGEAASFRNGGAASSGRRTRRAAAAVLLSLGAGLVALSALTVLLVRARHDPPLNQGAPSTLPALLQVVQRSQYHVAPIWPRQAPAWLQMGNLIQYADFQVAMGLGRGPVPTAPRVAVTLAFAALAIVGARAHRKSDGVGWAAVLMLLLAGGPGAVAQLNLKAGPSYGHGVLPDAAPREARERDYFFLTAFAGWGVWAGMGGIALSGRARGRSLGLAAIALPLAPVMLNFGATSARLSPDAQLARDAAELMLLSAPENAILLTAGDNDTYPLWYLQMAERVRPDVYVVPVAMLPAEWFRAELASRAGLDARGSFPAERIASVIESAVDMDRPVAASPVLPLLAVPRDYSMHQLSPPAGAGTSRTTAGATNARGPQGWHWRGVVRVLDSGSHLPGLTERDSMAVIARLRRQAGSRLESEAQPTPKVDPAPDAVRARLLCAALRSGMWAPSRDTDLLARNCVVR